jgi:hypothetical protein
VTAPVGRFAFFHRAGKNHLDQAAHLTTGN